MGLEMALTTLVTGADGFVGSHLCKYLSDAGHAVIGSVREAKPLPHVVRSEAVGAIDGATDWSTALDGVDAVVHSAARVHVLNDPDNKPLDAFRRVNVDATVQLAKQAARQGCKRFVFISTIGVVGSVSDVPLCEINVPKPKTAYARSKWEAELALHTVAYDTGLPLVILRPPLVYGPGVKANFLRLMQAAIRGSAMPFGMVDNARDFLSTENLCNAVELCLTHPDATGETYHLCDAAPVSTARLITLIAQAAGREANLLPVPQTLLLMGSVLLRKTAMYNSVCRSLRVDDTKLRTRLGWRSPQSLADGIFQVVQWYLAKGES